MRGNDLSRETERKRKKGPQRRRKKERKVDIDHRVKRKKKFLDPNFHYALLRFSASNGREERRRALHPRSSSLTKSTKQTKNFTFEKKKKLKSLSLSLSPCTRLAPKSLCARSSASPGSSILKRRCSCLVPTPAPSPKRWPRKVESFPRWWCFCVA